MPSLLVCLAPFSPPADPTGELYSALSFSPGFAPETKISAYAKLLVMLAGIGSPGTIQEVLRGYIGDRSAKPVFTDGGGGDSGSGSGGGRNLFDVLGSGYQRPFELATLCLFNMNLVLSHCEKWMWPVLVPVCVLWAPVPCQPVSTYTPQLVLVGSPCPCLLPSVVALLPLVPPMPLFASASIICRSCCRERAGACI